MACVVSTTDIEATYWIKAGAETFPANGPGISCDDPAARASGPAAAATEPDSATAAGDVVEAYKCTVVPTDAAGYDWFAACEAGTDTIPLELTPLESSKGEVISTDTDADGEATFEDVAPGAHALGAVDVSWCHAASNGVDADGNVVVEPGGRSTVWILMCATNGDV
jgi:hypothetical protein